MDWNLYYPRARFPFLDPHLSWPRLSYFSCQPFPPQVHQDPFQASYQASLHPHHHFGNESKIIIPTSPSPHYSPHPLLHQQNFAYAPVDTSRLTIDVTTSRFIPSLPSGHVVHPIESELLACQAPVNLSSQGTTHLQTLHNAIPPATATSSFLTSSSHYQLCDPSLSNINSTSSYGLPSPCHINNNNSMPTYSPRVDTLSVPLITLTPKVIQPQESVRVPIDQKPNVSDDALLTSTIVEAVTLSDSTSEVKEEIKLIKKEVLEVESSESKENEDCTKSNPVSSVEEVKIPSSSTKSEKTKTEKAKDGSVKIPTTDLKQLKFLSSKNVNKSASKSCCIKPTIVPVTSDSELSQSTKTKNVIEKSSSILTCEQSKVGKEKKVAGSKVGKIKVPTRTIEVQCDGPDWTPVVLRTQVKNRLLKIKKKDDKDKQHGNSDGGKLKESKKKVEKFSPSPTSLEDDKKTKKSKQEPPKQEEGNEEKRNDDERNKKKTKNGNKTKKLSSKSSSSKSLEHETSQYPEQVESDPSSLPASTSCLKLKASSSTTTSTETMTQITPKRKIVGDGTGESGSKKKKVKKERSDISDQAKKSKKEQGPKSCELKNAVKRAAGKNVEKKKKDEDGSKKKKSKETKKQKLLHGSTIECINKKSIIIPVDQIKFLKPAPALTLNNVEKEQGVKIEVSGDGRKDTSQPLPPPPPLQLIKPSSPASKNNKLTKEKGKENSKKSKSPSLKKDDSSMSSISPFKIPSPNVRQRKIKSGLDMIRNRKKKVVKMVQMQQQQPSNSPKVNSPEVHQQQQSSVTKRLSVNRAIGETVLHRASRLGYKDIVISVLSNCDIDAIDARDNAGYTPLHECSARGHFDIAQLLLSHGADVNASAAGGIKPLHDAVEGDHVQLVRLLLSYGADPTISTYAGETAFNLSKSRSMTEFIRGFLSDLNGESPDGKAVLPWKFASSSSCLDPKVSKQGYDCLRDVPHGDIGHRGLDKGSKFRRRKEVKIEESDRPFCPSYWIPPSIIASSRSAGSTSSPASSSSSSAETSNYLLLSDVLHHLKLKKEDFYRRFRDQVRIVSVPGEEFDSKATCNQVLTSVPSAQDRISSNNQQPLRGTKRRASQDSVFAVPGIMIKTTATASSSSHQESDVSTVDVVLLNDSLRTILDIQVITVR